MNPTTQEIVCFGEVLWDVLPDKSLPGGAPMNVAYHLKKLGAHPALITRIGQDEPGQKLVAMLAASGLSTQYIQEDPAQATGLVYAKIGESHEVTYDIVYPSAWDFIEWEKKLSEAVIPSSFFVYGSLTSRSGQSRDTLFRLLEVAKTKVLDINLRPPHFNRQQVGDLLGKTDILKMNLSELELIAGWYGRYNRLEDQMSLLQERFAIETVIVTLGGEGAILLDKGMVSRHPGFQVQVADTIGSGDAFLAGYLSRKLNGAAPAHALAFACGTGALVASRTGGCPQYEESEILELMNAHPQQLTSAPIKI